MDFPNVNILDALLYTNGQRERWNNVRHEMLQDRERAEHFEGLQLEVWHHPMEELPRDRPIPGPDSELAEAGDGPHNNVLDEWVHIPIPLLFPGGRRTNIPEVYANTVLPVMMGFSKFVFEIVLEKLGIDMQSVFIGGLSYNVYLAMFQCFLVLSAFWLKRSSEMHF